MLVSSWMGVIEKIPRRLTQFRGDVKQAPVFLQRKAVGHPCNIIGNMMRALRLVGAYKPGMPIFRQAGMVGCKGGV